MVQRALKVGLFTLAYFVLTRLRSFAMRDHLITGLLSSVLSIAVLHYWPRDEKLRELEVDRLIVRHELIVSDTGEIWEPGYEVQQIPRGIYAKSLKDSPGGLWVRSRLIKGEIDDPFDDRFHAMESDGSFRKAPGHISWNVWLDGAWRQMAIIQGEGLEETELPRQSWNGGSHPGRVRIQSFRPNHPEPLTDALIGQGGMSIGGGGYGGGGLPAPRDVLELWGGSIVQHELQRPEPLTIIAQLGSKVHRYSLVALGPHGLTSKPSEPIEATEEVTLEWDSVAGADSYLLLRDGEVLAGPLRIEGSKKRWLQKVQP